MHNDALVVSLSMTRLQALLLRNAVTDSRTCCCRDLRRFAPDTDEYGDIQRRIVQLDDLSGSMIEVLRDSSAQTLAVLSIQDDVSPGDVSHRGFGAADSLGDILLEEFDHV